MKILFCLKRRFKMKIGAELKSISLKLYNKLNNMLLTEILFKY